MDRIHITIFTRGGQKHQIMILKGISLIYTIYRFANTFPAKQYSYFFIEENDNILLIDYALILCKN